MLSISGLHRVVSAFIPGRKCDDRKLSDANDENIQHYSFQLKRSHYFFVNSHFRYVRFNGRIVYKIIHSLLHVHVVVRCILRNLNGDGGYDTLKNEIMNILIRSESDDRMANNEAQTLRRLYSLFRLFCALCSSRRKIDGLIACALARAPMNGHKLSFALSFTVFLTVAMKRNRLENDHKEDMHLSGTYSASKSKMKNFKILGFHYYLLRLRNVFVAVVGVDGVAHCICLI